MCLLGGDVFNVVVVVYELIIFVLMQLFFEYFVLEIFLDPQAEDLS